MVSVLVQIYITVSVVCFFQIRSYLHNYIFSSLFVCRNVLCVYVNLKAQLLNDLSREAKSEFYHVCLSLSQG